MDHDGSFIFHESNYLQSSFSAFQDMRIKRKHTDVVIKARDREFWAHRVVLAARIPYFNKILSTQEKEVLLHELDPSVLESLINFAYEGKLKIISTNVQPIFFAAVCLHLQQVQRICRDFMAKAYSSSPDPTTLSFVKVIPSDASIRENFNDFCNSEEFLFLPYYVVKEIISWDELKVKNEEIVFEAVIKWTKVSLAERQHCLPYLLPEIRMNYLTPEYLIEKVAAEGLIKMSEQCKHVVEEAKSYHLLKKRVMFLSFKTSPRIYSGVVVNFTCDTTTAVAANQTILRNESITTAAPNISESDPVVIPMLAKSISSRSLNSASEASTCPTSNNVPITVKHGIYAVRSFASVGTFVSYFDHRSNNWDNYPQNAQNDLALHVVCVKDKLFIFFENETKTFDLKTYEWGVLEPLQSAIKGAGVVAHSDIIYVFGGLHFPHKVQRFDTQQNKWVQDEQMKYPCRSMGVASAPGKYIYLTGGFNTDCCRLFLRYHTITKQWTELTSMICPRMDHSSSVVNGKVYVCGGRNSSTRFLSSVELHNCETNQWTFVSCPKLPRHSLSLVPFNNKLYLLGGMTEKENCFSGVEIYDPDTNSWLPGVPVPHDSRIGQGPSLLPSPPVTAAVFPAVIKAVVVNAQTY